MEDFLASLELSENTRKSYRQGLRHFREYRQGRDLSLRLTKGFAEWLKMKDLSPASQRLYITSVIRYLHYKGEKESANLIPLIYILKDRLAELEPQKKDNYDLPTPEEIQRVLNWVDHPPEDLIESENLAWYRNRALFKLLLSTGLRISEVSRIKLGDIDWHDDTINVIVKRNKPSKAVMCPKVKQGLSDYLTLRSKIDTNQSSPIDLLPLFSQHGRGAGKQIKPITTRTIENIVAHLKKMAGIESDMTPHTLRHYAATNMLEKTGNAFMVGHALGHNHLATTRIYTHTPKTTSLDQLKALGNELLEPIAK